MITMDRGENNREENNNWAGGEVRTRQRSKKKKAGHVYHGRKERTLNSVRTSCVIE